MEVTLFITTLTTHSRLMIYLWNDIIIWGLTRGVTKLRVSIRARLRLPRKLRHQRSHAGYIIGMTWTTCEDTSR
jgi:hypothetical protein